MTVTYFISTITAWSQEERRSDSLQKLMMSVTFTLWRAIQRIQHRASTQYRAYNTRV